MKTFWFAVLLSLGSGIAGFASDIEDARQGVREVAALACGTAKNTNDKDMQKALQPFLKARRADLLKLSQAELKELTGLSAEVQKSGDIAALIGRLQQEVAVLQGVDFCAAAPDVSGPPAVAVGKPGAPAAAPATAPAAPVAAATKPGSLTVTPNGVDFGGAQVDADASTKEFTLKNEGDEDILLDTPVISTTLTATGSVGPNFRVQSNDCPSKLAGKANCHVTVAFAPSGIEQRNATLAITAKAGTSPATTTNLGLSGTGKDSRSMETRLVAGFDISGASSTSAEQKFFLDSMLTAPVPLHIGGTPYSTKPLDRKLWLFVNPRISSVPQTSSVTTSDINLGAAFLGPVLTGKASDIVQSFGLRTGFEFNFIAPYKGARFGSGMKDTDARFTISLIGGVGFVTPLTQKADTLQVFKITPEVAERFPEAKDALTRATNPKQNVAFSTPDRSRFLRQYFGGVRFKTTYFGKNEETPKNIFPGMIDLTVGQNEAVTGGVLRGTVLTVDGVYPLPFLPAFHIFGSANVALGADHSLTPLQLQTATASGGGAIGFNDSSVFVQKVTLPNRDQYRIGVGLDIVALLKPKNKGNSDASTPAAGAAAAAAAAAVPAGVQLSPGQIAAAQDVAVTISGKGVETATLTPPKDCTATITSREKDKVTMKLNCPKAAIYDFGIKVTDEPVRDFPIVVK
jgi:hypothetical protein